MNTIVNNPINKYNSSSFIYYLRFATSISIEWLNYHTFPVYNLSYYFPHVQATAIQTSDKAFYFLYLLDSLFDLYFYLL